MSGGVIRLMIAGAAYALVLIIGSATAAGAGSERCSYFDTCAVDASSVDLRH